MVFPVPEGVEVDMAFQLLLPRAEKRRRDSEQRRSHTSGFTYSHGVCKVTTFYFTRVVVADFSNPCLRTLSSVSSPEFDLSNIDNYLHTVIACHTVDSIGDCLPSLVPKNSAQKELCQHQIF